MGAPAAGVCVCEALPINLFLASFAEWKNGTQRFGFGWWFSFGQNRGKATCLSRKAKPSLRGRSAACRVAETTSPDAPSQSHFRSICKQPDTDSIVNSSNN
jgi:hypothetical protein